MPILALAGDVMLGRLVNRWLECMPVSYPWGDTLPLWRAAAWRTCNLECVISDRGEPWPEKVFCFRSDPKNVGVLKVCGIHAVSLANNHVLDYGYEALAHMLEILAQAGIGHSGAGANARKAKEPALFKQGRLAVALVSFTDNEPQWEATEERPGIRYVPMRLDDPRAQEVFHQVERLDQEGYFVVASVHWGPNWGYKPLPEHLSFGRALIEAGASLVAGHSPHVPRGIEVYRGRPIVYSLGDFVDDYAVDPYERNDQSFLLWVEVEEGRPSRLLLHPVVLRDFQARRAQGQEAAEILGLLAELSRELGTQVEVWPDGACGEVALGAKLL
jgi:poly-gamma-glutamate capsule biosynthesis protein CapA/YwtB (metallophosphatase superfamily)